MINKSEFKNLIESGEKMDLHIHSYFSDGELSPEEIVGKWIDNNYKIIAITDHDGFDGSKRILLSRIPENINFISGIEFDSMNELGKDLHILGYGFDYDAKALNDSLAIIQGWRNERNEKMFQSINEAGYKITWDDVNRINEARYIGKPTFAKVLVNYGYAKNISEAFSKILDGIVKEFDIKKKVFSSKKVVDIIHSSQGIAVLAHPIEQRKKDEPWDSFQFRLVKILDKFVEYGIDGIECYHPSASEFHSEFLFDYATRHNLLITKGSDFHSAVKKRDYSKFLK